MSHLTYYAYPEHGARLRDLMHYSQSVRIGDRIECAGQCGWDPTTGEIPEDITQELENAFRNVDLNLRSAGGKGWEQVFKVRLYTTRMDEEVTGHFVTLLRKWTPEHSPILTGVAVAGLAAPTMHFEIEVEAHDPEGAKAAHP